jgi:peptide/nickel transport system permease protein
LRDVDLTMSNATRLFRVLSRTVMHAALTILIIILANFFLLQLAPGDAADVIAGESGFATPETMALIRERLGLDLPVAQQFLAYIGNLAHLSLGYSARYNMPVADLIAQRLPGTLILMISALVLAFVVGLLLGALMASTAGRVPDRAVAIIVSLLYSIPGFWIALMLIVLFSVKLSWLPSGGMETIGGGHSGFDFVLDRLRHLALPAISLSLFFIAIYARVTRAAMLEVATLDFVRTARAKGLARTRVALSHVLPNALLPVTTLAGIHAGGVLGGAVVVETVFSWPGLGRLAYEAVARRDYAVLLGILLLSSIVVIVINALVDLLQAWLDPRIGA